MNFKKILGLAVRL